MTVKLNLTIDKEVVAKSKRYAAGRKTTVSKIVQELLRKQLMHDEKMGNKKSFISQHAGTLSGKLSGTSVKKIKDEHFSRKYGY
jgi:Family of unknown function (DUF6364)